MTNKLAEYTTSFQRHMLREVLHAAGLPPSDIRFTGRSVWLVTLGTQAPEYVKALQALCVATLSITRFH